MKFDNIINNEFLNLSEINQSPCLDTLCEQIHVFKENPASIREKAIYQQGLKCPHCNGKDIFVHERTQRLRLKCKACKKTFNSTHGTVLHGIHSASKWQEFIPLFLQAKSIREVAKKLEISTRTAFDWRHKALSALAVQQTPNVNKGVVEVQELQFDYSVKGSRKSSQERKLKRGRSKKVSVLVIHDRVAHKSEMRVISGGSELTKSYRKELGLSESSLVFSENNQKLHKWAKKNGIPFQNFPKMKNLIRKDIHPLKKVMLHEAEFNQWFSRFFGVASKYLNNYLAWHNFLKKVENYAMDIQSAFLEILRSVETVKKYKNIALEFDNTKLSRVFATG